MIVFIEMESMNSKVDKNTWKEKFEAQMREVDRLKDLLNTLRRKHCTSRSHINSNFSKPLISSYLLTGMIPFLIMYSSFSRTFSSLQSCS